MLTADLLVRNIKSKSDVGIIARLAERIMADAYQLTEGLVSFPKQDAVEDEITILFDMVERKKNEIIDS